MFAMIKPKWSPDEAVISWKEMNTQKSDAWVNAVDSGHIQHGREVKLVANASLHLQRTQESLAAMQQKKLNKGSNPNLVIITGQPVW